MNEIKRYSYGISKAEKKMKEKERERERERERVEKHPMSRGWRSSPARVGVAFRAQKAPDARLTTRRLERHQTGNDRKLFRRRPRGNRTHVFTGGGAIYTRIFSYK